MSLDYESDAPRLALGCPSPGSVQSADREGMPGTGLLMAEAEVNLGFVEGSLPS